MTHFTWKSLLPFVLGLPMLIVLWGYLDKPDTFTAVNAVGVFVGWSFLGVLLAVPCLSVYAWYQNARAQGATRLQAALYVTAGLAGATLLSLALWWLFSTFSLLQALGSIVTVVLLIAAPWYILRERRYHASLNPIDLKAKRLK